MANITGTIDSEFLAGTREPDFILALAGNDTVLGQAGNDTIYGNEGQDSLRGDDNEDYLQGDQDNDIIYGNLGNDTGVGGLGNDTIFGNEGMDLLNGNDGNDIVNGNQGDDTLFGEEGQDYLRGGADNDRLFGNLGNDTLYGDLGNDSIQGNENDDLINGNEGEDILNGNEGNDTVRGGMDNDTVRGGMDNDKLYGDEGNDTVYGDQGNDSVFGGDGIDLLYGNEGNDAINGNEGNDTAFGGQGNDTIRGGIGNDSLFGDRGRDTLFGDQGADTLTGDSSGETNTDVFVIGRGTGGLTRTDADFITDFQLCIDLISLTGGVSYGDLNIFQGTGGDVANTIIQDKTTGEFLAVLQNVNSNSIDGAAFIPRGPERVSIAATNPTTIESTPTTAPGLFTVSVPCDTDEDLTVNYVISGIAINGTDYQTLSGSVIIPSGANSATIPVVAIDDTLVESDETVIATLTTGTGYDVAASPKNTATVTILDDDALTQTTVNIFASDPLASDATPPDPGQFTIARTGDLTQPLTVNYSVSPLSTATNNTDYKSTPTLSTSITIPAGSDRAIIDINPISDSAIEGNETITLFLGGGTDYTVGPANSATVIISDPPTAAKPTVFVTAPNPTTVEASGKTSTFQFARTGGDINQSVKINYVITGTATPNTDYSSTFSGNSITIAAGKTVSDPVSITAQGDGINEPTETVTVTISEDTSYFVGSQDMATVNILDNNQLNVPVPAPNKVLRFAQSGGNAIGSHATITEAVNAAGNNEIIFVLPGTYNEPGTIVINKPLTIRGPNAGLSPSTGLAGSPAIVRAPAGQRVIDIASGVNNVTIEGLRFELQGENAILDNDASNNILIRQNEFTGTGPATGGVMRFDYQGASGSSLTVQDNLIRDVTFNAGSSTSAIQAFRVDTLRITDNTIASVPGPGIAADAITNAASVINNNTISNTGQQGIQLAGGSATISNNDITNTNTTSGTDRGGIRLRDSGLTTAKLGTVNVTSNTITNSFNGIAIANGTNITGTININFNNLIGNTNAGLYHGGTGALNAKNNWWDSATGPTIGGTGRNAINGSGATVANVDFDPFATQPF
ncbi:Calx-beta domain-containing protein [Aerosakkonema sp. BLCC-F183]|uniref:Calx-beta domain-containing protein n=1 Tax=Aerosakkonema sp. BLCC-F183 TaxID=3342834 RepID=UPI0035B80FFA